MYIFQWEFGVPREMQGEYLKDFTGVKTAEDSFVTYRQAINTEVRELFCLLSIFRELNDPIL